MASKQEHPNHAEAPNKASWEQSWTISRRSFLKAVGVASTIGIPSVVTIPTVVAAQFTRTPASNAIGDIILASPLWQVVTQELAVFDFGFAGDGSQFTEASTRDNLVGLQTTHHKTPSPRTGADILVTFDGTQKTVGAIQYIIAGAQPASLEVHAVTLTPASLIFEEVQSRGGTLLRAGPRIEQHWSFPRLTQIPDMRAYPAIEKGWPDDTLGGPAWHYKGLQAATWQKGEQNFFWTGASVAEQFASDTARASDGEVRNVNLSSDETKGNA